MRAKAMRWCLKSIIFLSLCIAPALALAQEDCPAIIQSALDATDQQCEDIGRNQACYGNVQLHAEPQAGMASLDFEKPGDRVDVANVSTLTLSPWDADESTWGVSLMKLQANLPDTLPGQNVTFLLFGNVAIENAVETNTEPVTFAVTAQDNINVQGGPSIYDEPIGNLVSGETVTAIGRSSDSIWLQVELSDGSMGWVSADLVMADGDISQLSATDVDSDPPAALPPMQAFYFQTGIADAPCADAPDSGILVQTPEGGGQVTFTANEVNITLGSTAYLQAQPSGNMTVSVVEGQAEVTALNETRIVPAGMRVRIPLDSNRAASGPPGEVEPYTGRDIQGLPVGILDRVITVAAPIVEGEATAEATTEVAAGTPQEAILTAGTWQFTAEWLDCDRPPQGPTIMPGDFTFIMDSNAGTLIINFNGNGPTYERVEAGVYRVEVENEVATLTILSSDHFTVLYDFGTTADGECRAMLRDYTLVKAAD
jgi:uncharacterized protein YraI